MKKEHADSQTFWHCGTCGSTFFEQNGINRISQQTARKIGADKTEVIDLPPELSCPRDESVLIRITDEDAVPTEVELFRCPSCYGLFASATALVHFKKAQRAKIQFFKIWGKPMPSPRAVLAFGIIGALAISFALSVSTSYMRTGQNARADQEISNILLTPVGRSVSISFITSVPFTSEVIIKDGKSSESQTIVFSKDQTRVHIGIATVPETWKDPTYQIVLTSSKGKKILSDPELLFEKK